MPLSTGPGQPCPICTGYNYTTFFALDKVPTQDGMLWKSQAEALAAPTGQIKLAFCAACGYIGNVAFEPQKIRYDQDYSFSLYFSPTFRGFLTDVATRLIERFNLRHKRVLEIGCGEGDFLRLLCQLGPNQGLGVDPSTSARVEQVGAQQVTFLQDWYNEQYAHQDVDLICCRQALDQMPQPKAMIELVRRNIGARRNTAVYVEVPNAASIFEDMLIRNIMYEKSSWFTLYSLARMFELSGFQIVALEPCFEGGQYLGIEAVPAADTGPTFRPAGPTPQQFARSIQAFAENHQSKIKSWGERLAVIQQAGQRAIAWGSGAGGISFFSMLKVKAEIPYVVDINPKRQGRFLPLTGQEVVPPDFLHHYQPNVVIITNATYEQEIKQQVAAMGLDCSFWVI
jgi:SAM-dependent methyltransferase